MQNMTETLFVQETHRGIDIVVIVAQGMMHIPAIRAVPWARLGTVGPSARLWFNHAAKKELRVQLIRLTQGDGNEASRL